MVQGATGGWLTISFNTGRPSDMAAARRRVREELENRGVLEDKAWRVAEVWCSKVRAYHFTSRIVNGVK
jgi:hypothetical protein